MFLKPENYSSNVVKESFENVLKDKTMTTIKKLYKILNLDKELARKLLKKMLLIMNLDLHTEEI